MLFLKIIAVLFGDLEIDPIAFDAMQGKMELGTWTK